MKLSSVVAVFVTVLAVAATGCKYDKSGKGAGADGEFNEGQDISSVEGDSEGSLSSATEGKFEDMYTRCTDVNFSPVYFGFDSTVVPQGEIGKIDDVAAHLNSHADRVVVVEGHCDERGSNEYNMSLGESRATILRNYLVQSGISADRIQTRSYGEEKPADFGAGESAWSKNRRGEFVIFQK